MKLKPLAIVVFLLVAACAVVYWLRRPPAPAASDPRVGEALVDSAAVERAAEFELRHQGKTVTLKKSADGAWTVTSYHDLPAEFSKLSGFIGELAEAKLQRLVTTRAERIARLSLDDSKVTLKDADGKALVDLDFGRTAENGGRFVRFGDEEKAYLANLSAWFDAEPKNWADPKLLKLDSADVARVTVDLADGAKLVVTRPKKGDAWKGEGALESGELKVSAIDSAVSELTGLRFTETRALDDAQVLEARKHSRVATLETFGGEKYTFTFSRTPEEKKPKQPASDDVAATKSEEGATEKSAEPEFETIPAGPVFVDIRSSKDDAPINRAMDRRAFEVSEWIFNRLPQKVEDWK